MLNKFQNISHLQIDLEYNWDAEKLEKTTEDVIFHIIEETFTNSLKHGHATQVMIICSMKDNYYQLIIHNNGLSTPDFEPGVGLNYLQDLVSSLGGQIKFDGKIHRWPPVLDYQGRQIQDRQMADHRMCRAGIFRPYTITAIPELINLLFRPIFN